MFPTWGSVTPFTMTSASQFQVLPAPAIMSAGYAASILETECLGPAGSLSAPVESACAAAGGGKNFGLKSAGKVGTITGSIASNAQVALFWNDPGGGTPTPPGHWLQIADEVLQQQGVTDELQQARLGAMLGTAEAESGIAAWEARALAFLTGTLIRQARLPDGTRAAYLLDIGSEIKLGGNAVCLLALVKYTELSGNPQYLPLLEQLALGIRHMQDPQTGSFVHVLNAPALDVKDLHLGGVAALRLPGEVVALRTPLISAVHAAMLPRRQAGDNPPAERATAFP